MAVQVMTRTGRGDGADTCPSARFVQTQINKKETPRWRVALNLLGDTTRGREDLSSIHFDVGLRLNALQERAADPAEDAASFA